MATLPTRDNNVAGSYQLQARFFWINE